MKRILLNIHHRSLHTDLSLELEDSATMMDALKKADCMLQNDVKAGICPGLLYLVWHPKENRFYKQVAITGSCPGQQFIDIRETMNEPLPDKTQVIIIPDDGCATDFEERLPQSVPVKEKRG